MKCEYDTVIPDGTVIKTDSATSELHVTVAASNCDDCACALTALPWSGLRLYDETDSSTIINPDGWSNFYSLDSTFGCSVTTCSLHFTESTGIEASVPSTLATIDPSTNAVTVLRVDNPTTA